MNKQFFFKKKILFLWKCLWTCGLQLWQPGKKLSFRLSVFWIRVRKKCERLYIFQKMFFPKNFHGYIDCGFRNSGEIFAGSKHSLRIGKNSELFSFEKKNFINCSRGHLLLFCQPWKRFSAIVPKTSKIIRKSSSFQDFHSEMLICKCSTGKVESFLTTLPKNFLQKHRLFLSKSKKDEKQIVQQFLLTFLHLYA